MIEEYANNFRKEIWIKPPKEPIIVDIKIAAITANNLILLNKTLIAIKGFIFWSVNKIKKTGQDNPSTIEGNHWWKGGIPNFNIKIKNSAVDT